MTDEQKFFFDLRGWILLPGVLSQNEIESCKEDCYSNASTGDDDKSKGYIGALQELLDHPAIVPILSEILSDEPYIYGDAYGFRLENSFVSVRSPGWNMSEREDNGLPHVVRPPQRANAMSYQVRGGKIFSGLTRVVWELEDVIEGRGGTSFLNGSHKSDFAYGGPDPTQANVEGSPWEKTIRDNMQGYGCPPGSAVIFTESIVHAANNWTNHVNSRCAVFNCYNSAWSKWHRTQIDDDIISRMPPKRRSLFRGVWQIPGENKYSAFNRGV